MAGPTRRVSSESSLPSKASGTGVYSAADYQAGKLALEAHIGMIEEAVSALRFDEGISLDEGISTLATIGSHFIDGMTSQIPVVTCQVS